MIVKTQGIVLGSLKYGETSLIVRMYTRDFGYQSFILNSVRGPKARNSPGHFLPFSVLDIVHYMKPGQDLHRLSEQRTVIGWHDEELTRQSVLIFLSEILNKILRNDHSENRPLFDYMANALAWFKIHPHCPDFHVHFLLKLTSYVGFSIRSYAELALIPGRINSPGLNQYIDQLLDLDFQDSSLANGSIRAAALDLIIGYMQHHFPDFGQVRSMKVLQQIFR
jgi:DNA repair protein RecO (recombination protein O)